MYIFETGNVITVMNLRTCKFIYFHCLPLQTLNNIVFVDQGLLQGGNVLNFSFSLTFPPTFNVFPGL